MHSLTKLKYFVGVLMIAVLMLPSCKEEEASYGLDNQHIRPSNAEKTKLKTPEQYVSILYANLFQTALSSDNLFEVSQCIQSVGDKDLVHEVIISNYMNDGGVELPSDAEMMADVEQFVIETYHRFLVREPSEAELQYFKNYINSNPNVNSEMVYFAFALSNEYQYY
ncbi:MAG: hypothetical protein ACI9YU_001298 [Flavobacteriales bacterium]|jgi:hypothetical protein